MLPHGMLFTGAAKNAGEFYKPQQVSKILAKIVSTGKDSNELKSLEKEIQENDKEICGYCDELGIKPPL